MTLNYGMHFFEQAVARTKLYKLMAVGMLVLINVFVFYNFNLKDPLNTKPFPRPTIATEYHGTTEFGSTDYQRYIYKANKKKTV